MKTKNPVVIDGKVYKLAHVHEPLCRNCAMNNENLPCVTYEKQDGRLVFVCTEAGNMNDHGEYPVWVEVKNGNA